MNQPLENRRDAFNRAVTLIIATVSIAILVYGLSRERNAEREPEQKLSFSNTRVNTLCAELRDAAQDVTANSDQLERCLAEMVRIGSAG